MEYLRTTLKIIVATMLLLTLRSNAGMGDNPLLSKVTIDELDQQNNSEKSTAWDANAWLGYDLNKLYLYSEGERGKDGSTQSENQLVYSRAIASFWDIQAGIGYDKAGSNSQTWAVLALQGLAPYYFETRSALLLGNKGNVGLRLDAEYEALFTQKLILTPSIALDAYSQDNISMGIGKGLSNITVGMRLRYEIRREFAPYVGLEWSKNFGNTKSFRPLNEGYVLAGVRIWF